MTSSSKQVHHAVQDGIIEEDWSSYFHSSNGKSSNDTTTATTSTTGGDNNNSLLTGFSHHDEVTIQILPPTQAIVCEDEDADDYAGSISSSRKNILLKLHCVESLTPLDMINLSNGDNDSTGHRIWMGALFFIECFSCPLQVHVVPASMSCCNSVENQNGDDKEGNDDRNGDNDTIDEHSQQRRSKKQMIELLLSWRKKLFHRKNVLELGAGTGASGISLMVSSRYHSSMMRTLRTLDDQCHYEALEDEVVIVPKSITFTDADPTVLELCQKNIENNYSSQDENERHCKHNSNDIRHDVLCLEWRTCSNTTSPQNNNNDNASNHTSLFDTIIATDVVYDLGAIKPLIETSSLYLKKDGYFVLSHIPRASIDCKLGSSSIRDEIESFIVQEANRHGFVHVDFGFVDNGYRERYNVDYDDATGKDFCIRPSHLMKLQRDIITSDEVDFSDMESIGAGVMLFQKK